MNLSQEKVFRVLHMVQSELEFMPKGASKVTIPYDELLNVVEVPFDKIEKILEKIRIENRIKAYSLDDTNQLCTIEIDPGNDFHHQLLDYVLTVETFSVTGGKNYPPMTGKEIQAWIDELKKDPQKLAEVKKYSEARHQKFVDQLYSQPNYQDNAEWSAWRRRWEILRAIWSSYITTGKLDTAVVPHSAVLIRNRTLGEIRIVLESLVQEGCFATVTYLHDVVNLKHINHSYLKTAYTLTQEVYKKFAAQRDKGTQKLTSGGLPVSEFRIVIGNEEKIYQHKGTKRDYMVQCLYTYDRQRYKKIDEIIIWWEQQSSFPKLPSVFQRRRQYIINGLTDLRRDGFNGLNNILDQVSNGISETYRLDPSATVSFNKR